MQKGTRRRKTFSRKVGNKTLILDIFSPKTEQIRCLPNRQKWEVDLKPLRPMGWQAGRSLATRLEAEERAQGMCEQCKEKPVTHVHHISPMRGKSFLKRVQSDSNQRYAAKALCMECHLEAHGGSFSPAKARSSRNAGCAERCLPSVVTAP